MNGQMLDETLNLLQIKFVYNFFFWGGDIWSRRSPTDNSITTVCLIFLLCSNHDTVQFVLHFVAANIDVLVVEGYKNK